MRWVVLLALLGCNGGDPSKKAVEDSVPDRVADTDTDTDSDTDSDTDTDTDTDSDTDTDTDTDTDSDTDTAGPSLWMEGPQTQSFCAATGTVTASGLSGRMCFAPLDVSSGAAMDWQAGPIYAITP